VPPWSPDRVVLRDDLITHHLLAPHGPYYVGVYLAGIVTSRFIKHRQWGGGEGEGGGGGGWRGGEKRSELGRTLLLRLQRRAVTALASARRRARCLPSVSFETRPLSLGLPCMLAA